MVGLVICLVLAAACMVEAWLIREGVIQKWPRRYYAAENAPLHIRKGVFGLIPFAVAVLMLGGGIAVGGLGGGWEFLALAMGVVAVASFIVAFSWMDKPPEWVKPEWMKRAERGEEDLAHLAAIHGGRRLVAVPPWQYWGTWVFVVVIFVLWLVLHLPAGILVGLGFAIPLLASGRPTRHPPD